MLGGCDGSPGPSPSTSTPLFADEAEAFAAAEATYRAYIDAVNLANEGREGTDTQSFLIGEALEAESDSQRQMDDAGTHISGVLKVATFAPLDYDTDKGTATAGVCLDISETSIRDANDMDVTPSGRPSLVPLIIGFQTHGRELRISSTQPAEDTSPC